MEISRTNRMPYLLVRFAWCALVLLLPLMLLAQNQYPKYLVKGGRMKIEIGRNVQQPVLDSFISQFDLAHLKLKDLVYGNSAAGIAAAGWQVDKISKDVFIISKPFHPIKELNTPEGRIRFAEHHPTFAERFPATNNGLTFGANRFRNKQPFTARPDSAVRFFIRGYQNAGKVMLAGSFNDWDPEALSMHRTDSGWVADVKLGPGKYWYKFIADGHWLVDGDNQVKENDGEGNINSVYFRTNTVFFLPGFEGAKNVSLAGSFNQWRPRELAMQRTAGGWVLPLYLSEGTHAYKFVVDGQWVADSRNPNKLPDGHGAYNSFIALGKPHLFRLTGYAQAKEVKVVGSFNNWRDFELPMHKTANGWELSYVLGPGNYEYKFLVDGQWIADPARPAISGNNSSMVIGPNYTFHLKGFDDAKQVFIAGDFNNWNPASFPMKREGGEWKLPLHLWTGKHRYKFIVDGKWVLDPLNKLWEQNEYGTGNSVLWIGN